MDGSVGLLYNIPWGGLGQQSDYSAARAGSTADYLILRYGVNGVSRPGADLMVRVAASGQYTPYRLIPGEQFGYGGGTVLRGYAEREESWDAGFSGSLELYSPELYGHLARELGELSRGIRLPGGQLRLLAFLDGGTGYNLRPQPGDLSGNALTSTGVGIRLGVGEYFSFSLDWGLALASSTQTRAGDSAVHFKGQLSY